MRTVDGRGWHGAIHSLPAPGRRAGMPTSAGGGRGEKRRKTQRQSGTTGMKHPLGFPQARGPPNNNTEPGAPQNERGKRALKRGIEEGRNMEQLRTITEPGANRPVPTERQEVPTGREGTEGGGRPGEEALQQAFRRDPPTSWSDSHLPPFPLIWEKILSC